MKTLLLAACAAIVALTLVACGSDGSPSTSDPAATTGGTGTGSAGLDRITRTTCPGADEVSETVGTQLVALYPPEVMSGSLSCTYAPVADPNVTQTSYLLTMTQAPQTAAEFTATQTGIGQAEDVADYTGIGDQAFISRPRNADSNGAYLTIVARFGDRVASAAISSKPGVTADEVRKLFSLLA